MKLIIILELFFSKEMTLISVRTRVNLLTVGKVKTKEIKDIFFFFCRRHRKWEWKVVGVSSPVTENTNLVSNSKKIYFRKTINYNELSIFFLFFFILFFGYELRIYIHIFIY